MEGKEKVFIFGTVCLLSIKALTTSGAPGLDVGKGIARGTTGQMVELQEVKCSLNPPHWPTKK